MVQVPSCCHSTHFMDQHTFYLSLKFLYPAAHDNGAENPSWYANSRSAYQEVPTFGRISTAFLLLTKCSSPDRIMSQVHLMRTVRSTFTLFYLCLGLPNGLLPLHFLKDVELQAYWCQTGNKLTDTNVYWTVHHCNSWRMKDQLDVTCYFISHLMCSTCFGH